MNRFTRLARNQAAPPVRHAVRARVIYHRCSPLRVIADSQAARSKVRTKGQLQRMGALR
jgi:hypothetical protein